MDEMTASNVQDTIPDMNAEVESPQTETEEPATAPQEQENSEEVGANNTADEQPEMQSIRVQYNHEDVDVPIDEAREHIQFSKFIKSLDKSIGADAKGILTQLDYLSAVTGTPVNDLVKGLVDGVDSKYRAELTEQLGEDSPLIEELLASRREKNQKTYEEAKSRRAQDAQKEKEQEAQSINTRLATQFEAVAGDFPEYKTVADIPDAVLKRAIKGGDLEKELLRFKLSEGRKVEAAKAAEQKNKNENIGSVQTEEAESGIFAEMMKGLWG